MKQNDLLLGTSVALYSFLFYQQSFGINFLIFTVALALLLLARNKELLTSKYWLMAAGGSLLSGLCVAWYGNTLSFTANIISLSLLSAFSMNNSSLLFALLFSFYSYASSLVFMFIDRLDKKQNEEEKTPTGSVKKITLILIPTVIALVFFFMYRGSNALFNEFAKKINFDFVSMNWIAFTLAGFVLLYGFFHYKKISAFSDFDERSKNSIDPNASRTITLFGKQWSIADENFSGIALFLMLNVLLLIVNGLDFNFLFVDGKLPEELSYSEFVHQGIGMLITSIIAGVLIILFYFRGAMNFYEKSPMLKLLSYLWIIQNLCMLFSTAMRNDMYISEYGLTYKRIGVYVYLFLTVIGLCTTLVKVGKAKSNMFLFRINSWLFYGLLVVSCFFAWDDIITDHNIHKAHQLEKKYLVSLSYSNLPQLYELRADSAHKHKEFILEPTEYDSRNSYTPTFNFEGELNKKLFLFVHHRELAGWRSWNWHGADVYKRIENMQICKNISHLDLNSCELYTLDGIQHFTGLKNLALYNTRLTTLEGIENLQQLEELNLQSNTIADLSPLYALKNLKTLHLPGSSPEEISKLKMQLPNTLIN